METQPPPPHRRRIMFAGAILALALGLGIAAMVYNNSLPSLKSTGVALVGGPFEMVNHRSEKVTEKTFAGRPMLLFFGFTFCPDICPTELQVMIQALDNLGAKGEAIQPIFVTVDPARDTPEVMASYVASFSPRLVGLTGSSEQVAAMAKTYRVFFAKVENAKNPGDYAMDHSSIIYLMGADGKFLKHFTYTADAAALAEGIAQSLE